MQTIKFIIFIELLALFVCGASHLLSSFIKGIEFSIKIYWIIPTIVLVCCLLVIYVIAPIGDWFFFGNQNTK